MNRDKQAEFIKEDIHKNMKSIKNYEKYKKRIIHTLIILTFTFLLCITGALMLNIYIKGSSKDKILSSDDALKIEDIDCILVLGAGVREDNTPSHMLEDRLLESISLYEKQAAPKILMSGDHGRENYDEVSVMKKFAINKGVPSEDIFMDHAGFSTYESLYRAKEIFGCKRIVIVTQKYHLYRALYIADSLGIEAYGVPSDPRTYFGQSYRELREILARDKDFFSCLFKVRPTYLGDPISLDQSGDITNDESFDSHK